MFEVFTFFTDTFQAPVLCHVANVLAELLVFIDFLNFSDFNSVTLRRTDASKHPKESAANTRVYTVRR